jgi:putative transposase
MKISRYTEAQIIAILWQAEGGVPVAELCGEHSMSNASFYKWRAKYGGMDASLISQMKAMEDENLRLKRMYADLSMQRGGSVDLNRLWASFEWFSAFVTPPPPRVSAG